MSTFPIVNHRQRAVLSAAIICSIVPSAAVVLRLVARRISARPLNLSDYCAVVAAASTIALEALSIAAVFHGGLAYGHASEIVAQFGSTPVVTLLKLLLPLQLLWALSLGFSKTSTLLLYSHLFKPEHYAITVTRATIAVNAVWAIGTILAACLICQPFSMHWETVGGGFCGNQFLLLIISGAINLATNVVIVILPLPALYKLRLGIYKKFVLLAIFGVGLLACVTSVMRLVCLAQMDYGDIPYSMTLASIFSGLEPSMAVTLACIPLFRPLVGRCKHRSGANPGLGSPRREQFEPLGDDAGGGDQLRLRPLSFKHQAEISAVPKGNETSHESRDDSDFEAQVDRDHAPGILVSREWEVTR